MGVVMATCIVAPTHGCRSLVTLVWRCVCAVRLCGLSLQYIVKVKTGDDAPEVKSEKMGTISLEEERTRNNDMQNFKGMTLGLPSSCLRAFFLGYAKVHSRVRLPAVWSQYSTVTHLISDHLYTYIADVWG